MDPVGARRTPIARDSELVQSTPIVREMTTATTQTLAKSKKTKMALVRTTTSAGAKGLATSTSNALETLCVQVTKRSKRSFVIKMRARMSGESESADKTVTARGTELVSGSSALVSVDVEKTT